MSFTQCIFKSIAALVHVPGDALDYYFASTRMARAGETTLPFPAELVSIGARLVLRGWLNGRFFPANRDWILPYWAERQFDPNDPAFIPPSGFNLYTFNQTHRDWTMIGNLDSAREAIVDPRGLVTPWFDGWSLDTWLQVDGRLYAPSRLPDEHVTQSLVESLPIVATTSRAGELIVRTEAFAAVDASEEEWVVQDVTVENQSPQVRTATLLLSIRPFNPEGVSLVKRIEYRTEERAGRKVEGGGQGGKESGSDGNGAGGASGSQAAGAFFVNGSLAAVLPATDGVAMSAFPECDAALALPELNRLTRVETDTGLATAVAAYRLELAPGASQRIGVRMPIEANEYDEDAPRLELPAISPSAISELRDKTISTWRDKLAQGMRIRVPDERMQGAFEANKAFLLLLHDGSTITPGPFTYHQFWFRDAAFMLNALDKLGYHKEARQVIDTFPRRLQKDGYLRATEGEWDANGEALWTMVENARLSGEKDLVAKHYWSILRMASWINSKRRQGTAHPEGTRGLLPPGPSAEHLGPSDYYYWDDFWGLAGLREAARVAEWMGLTNDAAKLRRNYESFRADVDASLAAAARRLGRPAMPAAPDRRLDAGMIGNLVSLYPLRLLEPNDPRIMDTLAALKDKAWVQDAYFNHVGHSALGTYLNLHVAECYLFQRDPEAWRIIEWVLDHASPTFTWAEGLHPITRRGGMGDGHHGWAVADFLLATRNLLLCDEEDHLVITPGLPQAWTAENNVIKVEDAATYFGSVTFTVAFGARTGTLVVAGDWHAAPSYIEWDLGVPLREAGADIAGAEIVGSRVRLPQGARRVVVMW